MIFVEPLVVGGGHNRVHENVLFAGTAIHRGVAEDAEVAQRNPCLFSEQPHTVAAATTQGIEIDLVDWNWSPPHPQRDRGKRDLLLSLKETPSIAQSPAGDWVTNPSTAQPAAGGCLKRFFPVFGAAPVFSRPVEMPERIFGTLSLNISFKEIKHHARSVFES